MRIRTGASNKREKQLVDAERGHVIVRVEVGIDMPCAFPCPVNCVVGGFEEVRIQMLTLGHSHSSSGKV